MDEKIVSLLDEAANSLKQLYHLEILDCDNPNSHNIFDNKYKIRGILVSIAEKAKTLIPSGDLDVILLWGFFTAKLANNFIETEEPKAEARSRLLEITKFFDSRWNSKNEDEILKFSGLLQYTYNSLAVATEIDSKDEYKSSLFWLTKAQTVYRDFKSEMGDLRGPECWETLAVLSTSTSEYTQVKKIIFETGYTTTLFMLAQVSSNTDEKQKSAEYCRETLCRQLKFASEVDKLLTDYGVANQRMDKVKNAEESVAILPSDWLVASLQRFDPKDWANNTASLSEFYTEIGSNIGALECLMTAKT